MKKKILLKNILLYSSILIFSYSLVEKTIKFDDFLKNLGLSELFPQNKIILLASAILLVEGLIIVFLIIKEYMGILLVGLFYVTSTIYIIATERFGNYERCGCGGFFDYLSFNQHLVVNIFYILLTLYILKSSTNEIH